MTELTPQQAEYVRHFSANGGRGTDAAIKAGYAEGSAAQRSYELRHKPHVAAAITAEMRRGVVELAPLAITWAKKMLENDKTPPGARVQLIMTIFDRAGLAAQRAGDEGDGDEKSLRDMSLQELEGLARQFRDGRETERAD